MERAETQWTASRRLRLVLDILRGRMSVSEAAGRYRLPASRIARWLRLARRGALTELRGRADAAPRESDHEHYVEYL